MQLAFSLRFLYFFLFYFLLFSFSLSFFFLLFSLFFTSYSSTSFLFLPYLSLLSSFLLTSHNFNISHLHLQTLQVSTPELAEVFAINAIAPAIINARYIWYRWPVSEGTSIMFSVQFFLFLISHSTLDILLLSLKFSPALTSTLSFILVLIPSPVFTSRLSTSSDVTTFEILFPILSD